MKWVAYLGGSAARSSASRADSCSWSTAGGRWGWGWGWGWVGVGVAVGGDSGWGWGRGGVDDRAQILLPEVAPAVSRCHHQPPHRAPSSPRAPAAGAGRRRACARASGRGTPPAASAARPRAGASALGRGPRAALLYSSHRAVGGLGGVLQVAGEEKRSQGNKRG